MATWRESLASLWIYEVWQLVHPTFIVLVTDAARFLILMVMLALGHHVIEWVPASQARRLWLEGIHFYVITGAWLFFNGVLFIELVAVFFIQIQDSVKRGARKPRE